VHSYTYYVCKIPTHSRTEQRDLHINVIVYSRQSVDCMRIFHDDDVYYTSVRGGGA
jgi:hypothetical protein